MRQSNDEIKDGKVFNGFDYSLQVWVIKGIIQRCGHKESMDCGCEKGVFACRTHAHLQPTPTPLTPIPDDLKVDSPNRAYIVRAVNCHEELVGLLKKCRYEMGKTQPDYFLQAIDATIAKAEGK